MTTYNVKYQYNSQPTITATETDLDVDYPYSMLWTLLNALTVNQRKNLKSILITSGVSDKHKTGYKKEIDLAPTYPFYKVVLTANKTILNKGDTVTLTATVTNVPTITKVEFYSNSSKLGEDTTAPYTLSNKFSSPGNYLITAKVTDSTNVITTSNVINLTVN